MGYVEIKASYYTNMSSDENQYFHWQPNGFILKDWIREGDFEKCEHCDFKFLSEELPPIKRKLGYKLCDSGKRRIKTGPVKIYPGLDYYKKRYEIGMTKQNHWDECHPVVPGLGKKMEKQK